MKVQINPTLAHRFHLNLIAILLLAVLFNAFNSQAQKVKNFNTSQPFLFEENKGQLMDESGNALSDIKYYGKQGGVYVYCKSGMLSFVFTKIEKGQDDVSEATGMETESPFGKHVPTYSGGAGGFKRSSLSALHTSITASRMDLVLLGSNPTPSITATDQQEYYENFYTGGDANHGITNVHTYKTLTYKNIYPNIDMNLNVAKNGIEYSFLVHPGGNVSDIKLRWNGAEKEEALKNGGIKYANTLGTLEESAPKSFVEGKLVKSISVKKGLEYSFEVGGYDKRKDLVIDPSLVWGTYFGGSTEELIYGITTDNLKNIYIIGESTSKTGITTTGAFETSTPSTNNGAVLLAKFNENGTPAWVTYYAGNSQDWGLAITTDYLGNLYFTGYTYSSSGIATNGTYQTSTVGNGYSDVFIAKFSTDGIRKWGTYFGGAGDEFGFDIKMDGHSNLYVTGKTNSKSNIATKGAFQTSFSGKIDAFLARFDSSGNLNWATYFGADSTIGEKIVSDLSGNVFLSGVTDSNSVIATKGAYQTSYGGGRNDAFIAKFNKNGNRIWSTYFGGNCWESFNSSQGIVADKKGHLYLSGGTCSQTGIATAGAYQTSIGGEMMFIWLNSILVGK